MPAQVPTQQSVFIVFISAGAMRSLIRLWWQLRPLISQQNTQRQLHGWCCSPGKSSELLRGGLKTSICRIFFLCSVSDLPPAFGGDVLRMHFIDLSKVFKLDALRSLKEAHC